MATSFKWDPASDQTYDENDGDQKNYDGDFGKDAGRNFTMSGGSLALLATTPALWLWGRPVGPDGTVKNNNFIFTRNSRFSMFGNQVAGFALFDDPDNESVGELSIFLADDAIFTVRDLASFEVYSGNVQAEFLLKDRSQCNFNSIEHGEFGFKLNLFDEASFNVSAINSLQISRLTVDANAVVFMDPKTSSHFSLESKGVIIFDSNNSLSFKKGSGAIIRTGEIMFQSPSTEIVASDSAAVTLDSTKISFADGDGTPYFKLESGGATILFTELVAKDFLDKAPVGSLYFDTKNGANHGQFVLNGCGSDFLFEKLIAHKIVSIDENTDPNYVRGRLKTRNYVDFNLILELAD